jgi:hypothetical protein
MPAPRAPEWICATVPKRGSRAEENEDATVAARDALRFAVADGATEGWESGPWAAHLAAAYIAGPPEPMNFADWLATAREWAPRSAEGKKEAQPWYVSEKQEEGSFATLLGLEVRRSQRSNGWAWRAVAIGDSCLFHIRGGKLALAFPLESATEFGTRPALISSAKSRTCPEPEWCAGRAEAGDLLLLATDAASARLFAPAARDAALRAVGDALAARDSEPLTEWCRSVQDVVNDDVTILAIRLPAG